MHCKAAPVPYVFFFILFAELECTANSDSMLNPNMSQTPSDTTRGVVTITVGSHMYNSTYSSERPPPELGHARRRRPLTVLTAYLSWPIQESIFQIVIISLKKRLSPRQFFKPPPVFSCSLLMWKRIKNWLSSTCLNTISTLIKGDGQKHPKWLKSC